MRITPPSQPPPSALVRKLVRIVEVKVINNIPVA
jgi:hypothetical protein